MWYLLRLRGVGILLLAMIGIGSPALLDPARADPNSSVQDLHVPISIQGLVDHADSVFQALDLQFGSERSIGLQTPSHGRRPNALPGSAHFDGLAGALNLVVNEIEGRPQVNGIALAPKETLRFIAGRMEGIRGLQGRISIQLDF